MNSLIVMMDDGISGFAWAQRAKNFLDQGKKVVAVTDTRNNFDVIGMGDGLSTMEDRGLTAYPNFSIIKVALATDEALLAAIASADEQAVFCWNIDLFLLADSNGRNAVIDLLAACAKGKGSHMFCLFGDSRMCYEGQYPHVDLVRMANVSSISGFRIAQTYESRELLMRMAPDAYLKAKFANVPLTQNNIIWEVLGDDGFRRFSFKYLEAEKNPEQYRDI